MCNLGYVYEIKVLEFSAVCFSTHQKYYQLNSVLYCPHSGAVWSVLVVAGQAEAGGAPEQEHEDPYDRRTDPGGAVPLHRPRL